jgi:hypothetical protein
MEIHLYIASYFSDKLNYHKRALKISHEIINPKTKQQGRINQYLCVTLN